MAHWSSEDTRSSGTPDEPAGAPYVRQGQGTRAPAAPPAQDPPTSRFDRWFRMPPGPPQQELWYPGGDDRSWDPQDSAARRVAYVDAVDATRFDMPFVPSAPAVPFDSRNIERLIPARRGQVQGAGVRADGLSDSAIDWQRPGEWVETAKPAKPAAAPAKSGLLSSSATMAVGTIVSRVTGMLRQLVMVAGLGSGLLASQYTAANTLPNIVYILLVGGALNSVFVPQLVRAMNNDPDGGEAYTNRLLTVTIVGLTVLTTIAFVAAPQIVNLTTTQASNSAGHALTVTFARYCLPQIFFYGLWVMLGQILNARDRFGPMMWTSVLNNIVVIQTFGLYIWAEHGTRTNVTITSEQTRLLGIGTTLGIILQTITLIPYLRQVGVRFRPRFDWRNAGLGKAFTLAKWTILYMVVAQGSYIVLSKLAFSVDNANPEGGIGLAAYTNANTIWILPQAVITVSLITAMLPRMARAAANNDLASVREGISQGLRVSGVAIVPASFAFVALGPQMAVVLFLHGSSMDVTKAHAIGYMLMALGLGMIPFSAQYLMVRGFYAFEDTRTPFFLAFWIGVVNVILDLVSYEALKGSRWQVTAMCAANGVAYLIGVRLTARRLSERIGGLDGDRVLRTYVRLTVAAVPATIVAFVIGYGVNGMAGQAFFGSLLALLLGGAGLVGVFLVIARQMRIAEVDTMIGTVRARIGR